MQKIDAPGLDHNDMVVRRRAHRHFRNLLLGNACEEAALRTEPAPPGWWCFAEITRLELGGVTIRTEV